MTETSRGTVDTIHPVRNRINWITIIALVVFHAGAVAALFMFSWKVFLTTVVLYWMATGLGISMGYHRLHTHRSYKCPLWMEYLFAICGTLNLEGGPIFWVATHRVHHQKSDQPGDPHSPHDGAFWSHMGWILFGEANHANTKAMSKFAPDLSKHKFYVWLNNWHWVPMIGLGAILLAVGGWPMLFWGIFFRVTFGLHATWLVNSASHMWGYRRFKTRDDSRNNWFVALLTFGEGWHNNHHAHPSSARHGLAWFELDLSWLTFKMLSALGIIWDVKVAKLHSPVVEERQAA